MNMMHAALLALLMLEQTQNMNARTHAKSTSVIVKSPFWTIVQKPVVMGVLKASAIYKKT